MGLADEQATLALGAAAAAALPVRALPFIVALTGALGAGKTTFARGLLRALGVSGPIKSPSYALLETYETALGPVLHLDLYRLEDPEELEALGLRDYHQGRGLWLIEWPERGEGHLPPADARLSFEAGREGHRVQGVALSDDGAQWLGAFLTGPA